MIDLVVLYSILREVAMRGILISYGVLSRLYFECTGEPHSPHGTWDQPLGALNWFTHAAGLPAISAVVTYQWDQDDPDSEPCPPGNGFWGCPGVPHRPPTCDGRFFEWQRILKDVYAADWPEDLPG